MPHRSNKTQDSPNSESSDSIFLSQWETINNRITTLQDQMHRLTNKIKTIMKNNLKGNQNSTDVSQQEFTELSDKIKRLQAKFTDTTSVFSTKDAVQAVVRDSQQKMHSYIHNFIANISLSACPSLQQLYNRLSLIQTFKSNQQTKISMQAIIKQQSKGKQYSKANHQSKFIKQYKPEKQSKKTIQQYKSNKQFNSSQQPKNNHQSKNTHKQRQIVAVHKPYGVFQDRQGQAYAINLKSNQKVSKPYHVQKLTDSVPQQFKRQNICYSNDRYLSPKPRRQQLHDQSHSSSSSNKNIYHINNNKRVTKYEQQLKDATSLQLIPKQIEYIQQKMLQSKRVIEQSFEAKTPSECLIACAQKSSNKVYVYGQNQRVKSEHNLPQIIVSSVSSNPQDYQSSNRVSYLKQKLKHFQQINRKYQNDKNNCDRNNNSFSNKTQSNNHHSRTKNTTKHNSQRSPPENDRRTYDVQQLYFTGPDNARKYNNHTINLQTNNNHKSAQLNNNHSVQLNNNHSVQINNNHSAQLNKQKLGVLWNENNKYGISPRVSSSPHHKQEQDRILRGGPGTIVDVNINAVTSIGKLQQFLVDAQSSIECSYIVD